MATKASFRAKVVDFLNRPDLTTSKADEFLLDALTRVEGDLRVPSMEMSVSATVGSLGLITIPNGFLEAQRIEADDVPISLVTPERLLRVSPTVGGPAWAARVQGKYAIRPYPQSYATLYYWGAFNPLVADTDTNALLEGDSKVLFYAWLSYAADYFRMDELTLWEQRYQGEKDRLNLLAQDADLGPGPQAVLPAFWGGYQ